MLRLPSRIRGRVKYLRRTIQETEWISRCACCTARHDVVFYSEVILHLTPSRDSLRLLAYDMAAAIKNDGPPSADDIEYAWHRFVCIESVVRVCPEDRREEGDMAAVHIDVCFTTDISRDNADAFARARFEIPELSSCIHAVHCLVKKMALVHLPSAIAHGVVTMRDCHSPRIRTAMLGGDGRRQATVDLLRRFGHDNYADVVSPSGQMLAIEDRLTMTWSSLYGILED